jgi:DNA repair exonuclease SbcCD ATPase subunit
MARTTSTKHLKLKDELVELERYLVSFKESSQRSLQAIREGDARSAPNGSAADVSHTKLEAEIERLRKENSVLQNQLKSSAGDAANGDAVNALRAKCARLESELAAARTAAMAQQPRGAPSTSGSPPPAGSTPAANPDVLRKMQQDIAQLRQDREGLEDQVVNMYEDLFKDEIITGIVGLIRRKEVELAAQIDTAGSGAGRKNGAGKPVPRLKQKLDEATVKMEKLEKELKAKASEMDAAERHHQDMLKIATLEANAQAEHYKVRCLHIPEDNTQMKALSAEFSLPGEPARRHLARHCTKSLQSLALLATV